MIKRGDRTRQGATRMAFPVEEPDTLSYMDGIRPVAVRPLTYPERVPSPRGFLFSRHGFARSFWSAGGHRR
jgi:hypothetical protein